MRRAEIITGIVLLIAALIMIFVVLPSQSEIVEDASIQPSFYPSLALWAMAGFSALMVLLAILRPAIPNDAGPLQLRNFQTLLLLGAILAAAFVAIVYLGYIAGGVGLVAALMIYMGVSNPILLVSVSGGAPAVIWLFFEVLLERPLP